MAKLCPECEKKTPISTYRGSCQAKISTNCSSWTASYSFTLCDECADQLSLCAWCWGPLDGSLGAPAVPTTKKFCRQFDGDNGNHVEGMYVGEQILAQLQVDFYSGVLWRPTNLSREVSFSGYEVKRDAQNWRNGWMELYFDLNENVSKATIELEQISTSRWSRLSNPAKWTITVEIKR